MSRILIATLLAFLVSHCGEDQAPLTPGSSAAFNPATSTPEEITGQEMRPLVLPLTSYTADPLRPTQLPDGARYDDEQKVVYWIPKKGQEGLYPLEIPSASGAATNVSVRVNPIPEEELHFEGPPSYRAEDVGFVFLHGFSVGDQCKKDRARAHWNGFMDKMLPNAAARMAACYNGGASVHASALTVAPQVLNMSCGTYDRCLVVAHSMGNLIMEYIFTHDHVESGVDAATAATFAAVKKRVLMVVAVASAAGGARVASIMLHPERYPPHQRKVGSIAKHIVPGGAALRDLDVERATTAIAPTAADTEVPFFMIAGYSTANLPKGSSDDADASAFTANFALFNGVSYFAALDRGVEDASRSDGAVAFRSSCGIMGTDENLGPSYEAPLSQQLMFCAQAEKRKNHYLWFTVNLNHSYIKDNYRNCGAKKNPCRFHFLSKVSDTLTLHAESTGKNVPEVVRQRLLLEE